MSKNINGRKPLSSKVKSPVVSEPTFFSNKMSVSEDIKTELAKKGLDYRFIDYKKYVADGNNHSKGWTVYRSDSLKDTGSFLSGTNPDGIIRRGSTVLATRPLHQSQEHKDWLAQKASMSKGFKQAKADELRQMAKDNSLDTVVDGGFDGEDNE